MKMMKGLLYAVLFCAMALDACGMKCYLGWGCYCGDAVELVSYAHGDPVIKRERIEWNSGDTKQLAACVATTVAGVACFATEASMLIYFQTFYKDEVDGMGQQNLEVHPADPTLLPYYGLAAFSAGVAGGGAVGTAYKASRLVRYLLHGVSLDEEQSS